MQIFNARDAFLSTQKNFPKRYKRIIKEKNTHSDDEDDTNNQCRTIKILVYQSNAANIFFWHLDEIMAAENKNKRGLPRLLPCTPVYSKLTKPPKGLPLDFYKKCWLQEMPMSDQLNIPETASVAFLIDPKQLLYPSNNTLGFHPDKKLLDRQFNKKHLNWVVQLYGLGEGIEEQIAYKEGHIDADDDEDNEDEGISLYDAAGNPSVAYVKGGEWEGLYSSEDDETYEPEDQGEQEDKDEEDGGLVCYGNDSNEQMRVYKKGDADEDKDDVFWIKMTRRWKSKGDLGPTSLWPSRKD